MLRLTSKLVRFSSITTCQTLLQNHLTACPIRCGNVVTKFHNSIVCCSKNDESKSKSAEPEITPTVSSKYQLFNEDNATIILDMEEERKKLFDSEMEIEVVEEAAPNMFAGLNQERGKTGVFEIEDLVQVLKRDNAENIFVCTVPTHLKYVDYMVVITARSVRHMQAIAEFVRKVFKVKRGKNDIIPKIEGKNSDEWMAMDLGNIALHIFSAKARKIYDIEMLWSVGPEFDSETNKPDDPIYEMFDQHSFVYGEKTLENKSNSNSPSKNAVNLDQFQEPNVVKHNEFDEKLK